MALSYSLVFMIERNRLNPEPKTAIFANGIIHRSGARSAPFGH